MKIISICINDGSIIFDYERVNIDYLNHINKNEFIDNKLYYSRKYLKSKSNEVKKNLEQYLTYRFIYKNFDIFLLMSLFISSEYIVFDINKSLPIKVSKMLVNNKNLKTLECYFIPSDYVHILSNNNVSIKFNNDFSFTPNFTADNSLKNMKSIYYKEVICFYSDKVLYDNLKSFLSVNHSLKLIKLYFYSNEAIKFITNLLNEFNMLYTDIFIYQNDENSEALNENIDYLRKENKKFSKKGTREIKIIYSNEYVRENIFRELTINGLKFSMVILIYLGVFLIISNKYHEYILLLNLRKLDSTLNENVDFIDSIDEINDEEVNEPVVENSSEEERPKEYVNYYANIPTNFERLLEINSDVIGWLNVNDTKINYPVTHYGDNSYYLNHDIYSKEIITGWIFMDYRNDPVNLDQNTIIYGHNLLSGYMFGELYKTSYKDWYTNPINQVITFNTLDKEMKWRIFSIYRTDYTTDYLTTNFYDDEKFISFVNMIKGRSIYDFNVNIDVSDKILTLSTCSGSNNRRLVVHAVLINE